MRYAWTLLLAGALCLGLAGAALAAPQGLAPDVERSARTQRLEYAGKITLSGVLQVYWVPSWPDGSTEQRTLFIRSLETRLAKKPFDLAAEN